MWHSLELSPKRFFSLEVQPPSIQEHLVAENVQSVQVHDWLHDSSVLPLIAGVLLPFEDVLIRHRYLTTAAAWYPRDLAGATVETRYLDALKLFINKHMLLDGYSLDYIDHTSQQCKVITLSSPAQTVSGTPLSWRWPQDMCRRLGLPSFNGTDEKKALCVVKFVPPGALSESDVAISEDTVCPRESIANVMANLLNTAKEVRAPFGVLTDEICIIVFETIRYTEYPGMAVFTAADKPLRMILGALIHQEVCLMHLSAMDGARFLTQQSAVTKEWPMIQREVLRSREQALMKMKLCDWNPAALRDSPEQVDIFEFWAQNRRQQALQEAPFADVFDAFTDGFVKCYEKPIRLELPPLQSNQIAIGKAVNIFEQWMRPRNHALSQILEGQAFSFTVKKLLSTGGNRYSHLFLGKVNGCDEELLLKLYDERLFPIDDIKSQLSEERELYQSENLPEKFHLRDHECDFIARELAAYSALQSFQGSRQFEGRDGRRWFGALLEHVQGRVLSSKEDVINQQRFVQRMSFVSQLIKSFSVRKQRWFAHHIILHDASNDGKDIWPVVVGFADARQLLLGFDEENTRRPREYMLRRVLLDAGFSKKTMRSLQFDEQDEYSEPRKGTVAKEQTVEGKSSA